MAVYKSDQQDILFNLNDVLNISQFEKYGFDESSVKEIIIECDKFVQNEIFPTRQIGDEQGARLTEDGVKVPDGFIKLTKMYHEMGWYALGLPEDIGGSPVPEALVTACASLILGGNTAWSMYPGLTKGAMNVMRKVGDDFIQATFIPKIMAGTWGGTMCLTEAGAGSDVGNLKTTAKPIEAKEGWYKIKGTKIFISSGESDIYENNIHLVLARTPEGKEGIKGISLFVVPRFKVNEDGSCGDSNDVNCPSIEHKMGINGSATCVLNFGDDNNCEGYLIGKEFEGIQNMFIMMNQARIDVGMQGESQGHLAYEMTKQYVKERVQFGTEIINHPDIKKTMLKMRAMTRGMRSLLLYTTNLFDRVEEDKKFDDYIGFFVPIIKSFCSDQGFNMAVDAVQAHGGYGYCSEYGVEQFVRDIKISSIYEGTNAIQAIDFVTRKILKDEGKTLTAISTEILTAVNSLSDNFTFEKNIFTKAFEASQEAMEHIGKHAAKKEMNHVLQSCMDFLNLSAHLVIAWRQLESAKIAFDKLPTASGTEKEYLESKIVDFKIYCSQFLVKVPGLAQAIINADDDLTQYPI